MKVGIKEFISALQILGYDPEMNVLIEGVQVSVLCGSTCFLFKSSGGPVRKTIKQKIERLRSKGYTVETISKKEIAGIVKLSACQYTMVSDNDF